MNKFRAFEESAIKPHDKDVLLFDVSNDNKYLGSVVVGKGELVILDIENGFKQINKISFGIFDKKWDLILSSDHIYFTVLGKNLVAFYSEKLTFRFINFGKSKPSTFNFLSQNKYSKFDVKPAEAKEFLPSQPDSQLVPVYKTTVLNENTDDAIYKVVS